ncbi:aromatic-ring-hydroxylating dioxygenase subunit beta [Beijerinckia sp. L45]|uniref:aromatic-ring-hydroxylating dioxygenase subunit beta n=1 Tax=Beijerinckia sp. L45 TaxID=1641855 RepID=UPI00131DB52F|nr:aromatic-ring-hydroxylating dioxygenase subunit beta [Beijerinckia sp. L45]
MLAERPEIEDFLYREARLLDSQQFEEWMDLFTDDALYWVPAGHDDIDPSRHVSIIHDDKKAMAVRIKRLRSGHAYAQDPASRVHRLISNVELGEADDERETLEVTCMMLLVELARHRQTIHSARCEFSLDRSDGRWRITRKKVNLLRNGEVLESTPFLI